MNDRLRMSESVIDELISNMPHGSGIDYAYNWTKSNGKLILHNAFHNMDEVGGYDGVSFFKVHLILANDGCWIMDKIRWAKSITDPTTYHKYSESSLMEYLYETFYVHIDEHNQGLTEINDELVNFNLGKALLDQIEQIETENRMRVDEDYHNQQNSLYAMGDNPKF